MKVFNYQKICQELFKDLSERQKEIILRRFGLPPHQGFGERKRETLEAIGRDFGITRERVRQIEKAGFLKIKPKIVKYQKVFQYFSQYLKKYGGLRKEEILLTDLGGKKQRAQIYFLLTISENFVRFGEDKDFYSFWAINSDFFKAAKNTIEVLSEKLRKIGRPLSLKELGVLGSYLEISKKILQNADGLYGLKDWPEINPRGVKDKAYLVFKKLGKPLHFKEITKFIEGSLSQTVHNELIKDPRFVLVGRGIYALKEWGYERGQVKDVIAKILKENGPLTKSEILERVLKQRLVKENTILINLNNKKYFLKDAKGRYQLKTAII
ncbi:MAG: sigma factor-like helix-turn-helix DNA-binding protein [Patescibacteria group bacterium]|nr:sigma factor-like helix-turn-helix DNA-binding protein [Patescibacteria group bacterium]